MSVTGRLGSWWSRQVGQSEDYQAANSSVNRLRRAGLGEAAVGAGIGAAVGGAGGFAWGLQNLTQDRVEVVNVHYEVTRPVLVGADYDSAWTQTIPHYDGKGHFTHNTYIHHPADWDPIIERRGIGVFHDRQEFRHSMPFGPVAGTLVGLAGGAVLGGIAGAIVAAVKKDDSDGWHSPRVPDTEDKQRLARWADRAPLAGAAAGTVLGAAGGGLAGAVSQAHSQSLTQTVYDPVTRPELIGWIPHNRDRSSVKEYFRPGQKLYYHDLPRGAFGSEPFEGKEAIYRDVPTGELKGTETTELSHRLTPWTGALVGAAAGAAAGLLTGVAAGVLMKVAAGEDPPRY